MFNFWFFVPKSGLAFIILSVLNFYIWNIYKNRLSHPYIIIFAVELLLFLVCFYFTDRESRIKLKK
jgi:hypothetical protein